MGDFELPQLDETQEIEKILQMVEHTLKEKPLDNKNKSNRFSSQKRTKSVKFPQSQRLPVSKTERYYTRTEHAAASGSSPRWKTALLVGIFFAVVVAGMFAIYALYIAPHR